MPLPVRYVAAQRGRHDLPLVWAVSQHKLRALSVQNISNVIRELGSLARHAEGVMGEIADILASYHGRTCALEDRTRRLREVVIPSLDSEEEALEGFEIPHPSYHFRSDHTPSQHQLFRGNAPPPLLEQILTAATPPVDLFTPLWPDGRNAMELYSKPAFFFEQWRNAIQREALRRKSTHEILSPTRVPSVKRNGSSRISHKDSAKSSSLKRSGSLRRTGSFRSRSKSAAASHWRRSSTQSLTEVGKSSASLKTRPRVTSESLRRTYSVRMSAKPEAHGRSGGGGGLGVGLRYSLRRKHKDRPKLDTLAKTIAAAYAGSDIKLSSGTQATPTTPSVAIATSIEADKNGFKRNNIIRRSLSLRRSKSRSKSPVPVPPPTTVATAVATGNGKQQVKSLEGGIESSKYTSLSKKHLENLELGSASFETCLDVNSDKTKVTTFKFPGSALQSRSGSPLTLPPPSKLMPPPKVAPKPHSRSSRFSQEFDLPVQRSATVGTVNPEMRSIVDNIRRKRNQAAEAVRPASIAMDQDVASSHQLALRRTSKLSTSALSIPNPQGSQQKLSSSTHSIPFFQPSLPTLATFKPIEPLPTPSSSSTSPPLALKPTASPPQSSSGGGTPSKSRRPAPAIPLVNASPPLAPLTSAPPTNLALDAATPTFTSMATPTNDVATPTNIVTSVFTRVNSSPGPAPPPPRRTDSLSSNQNWNQSSQNRIQTNETIETSQPDVSSPKNTDLSDPVSPPNRNSLTNPKFFIPPECPQRTESSTSTFKNHRDSIAAAIGNTMTSINAKRNSTPLQEEPTSATTSFASTNFTESPRRKTSAFDPVASSPPAGMIKVRPRLVKQGSLYISPRKNSVMVCGLGVVTEGGGGAPDNVRVSQILRAGGVAAAEGEVDDQRSSLLEAIRRGTQLKKVEQEKQQHGELAWDVAAILERYVALHSDGEESDEESFTDTEEWSDPLGGGATA